MFLQARIQRPPILIVLAILLPVLALAAPPSRATTLTRQQAVAALLDPGSGIAFNDTTSAIWSPFVDFGSGAGYEGLLPAGSTVDPAYFATPPFSGSTMTAGVASYFFWIDDGFGKLFTHGVRFA